MELLNKANCATCDYKLSNNTQGHCYMFREEPRETCAKHRLPQQASTQPEALRLADWLDVSFGDTRKQAAAELRRLHAVNAELLTVAKELHESAAYWSEYDVPLGIVDRLNAAITKAEAA